MYNNIHYIHVAPTAKRTRDGALIPQITRYLSVLVVPKITPEGIWRVPFIDLEMKVGANLPPAGVEAISLSEAAAAATDSGLPKSANNTWKERGTWPKGEKVR